MLGPMSPVNNLYNFSPEIHDYSCPLYLLQSHKEPYRDPYSYKTNKIKGDLWYDIFVTCVLEPPAHTYIFQAPSSFHPTCFHFVINQKVTIVTRKYPGELEVYDTPPPPPPCVTPTGIKIILQTWALQRVSVEAMVYHTSELSSNWIRKPDSAWDI